MIEAMQVIMNGLSSSLGSKLTSRGAASVMGESAKASVTP